MIKVNINNMLEIKYAIISTIIIIIIIMIMMEGRNIEKPLDKRKYKNLLSDCCLTEMMC